MLLSAPSQHDIWYHDNGMRKSTTIMNSATMLIGYWMLFIMDVSCGIGDFAYLSVLHGTGINLGLLLLVHREVFVFGTNHFVNLECLLLLTANCLVILIN